MAGFLLDPNVLSEFQRRGAPDQNVAAWLRATDPDLLWASVLSFGEIRKGSERLAPGKRRSELERWLDHDLDQWFEQRLLPVTRAISERWGVLNVAATALEHDLTVVTRNVKDFANLDVKTCNPWEPVT